MSTSDKWTSIYNRIEGFGKAMNALTPEERSSEALVEIAKQIMELNGNIEDLVQATHRVADN